MATYKRLLTAPKSSFFLFGLRGTGKTNWSLNNFPSARRFDLLDERLYQSFLADPGLFAAELRLLARGAWVIVDEVQRLPQLLNAAHSAIEDQGLRFALLGSSARKLRAKGVNLLGGRALSRYMHPLLPAELGSDFSLDQQMRFGSLPLVLSSEDKQDRLETYVQTYLSAEIQAEALVRNLAGFVRFLPVAALFHAQVLNLSGLARDAGVHRATVEGYLSILEDTLLAYRLRAFEGKLRVKERSHPKLYWVDIGVMRAAKRQLGIPSLEERGPLFEGYIAFLLRAYKELRLLECEDIRYWAATDGSAEVDFLLLRDREIIAIEVKAAVKVHSSSLRSLRAVSALKNLRRKILVYLGEREFLTEDGIEVCPFHRFVGLLEAGKI